MSGKGTNKKRSRKRKKQQQRNLMIALIVLAVIIIVAAVFFVKNKSGKDGAFGGFFQKTESQDGEEQQTDSALPSDAQDEEDGSEGNTQGGSQNTSQNNPSNIPTVEAQPQKPIELVDESDASYEARLSAAMVIGLSMQFEYDGFVIDDIYLASDTTKKTKSESQGAYIAFHVGDENYLIHSKPLEQERNTAGSKDIKEENIGYATYDTVSPADVDTTDMKRVGMEDIESLLSESLLVSIIEH